MKQTLQGRVSSAVLFFSGERFGVTSPAISPHVCIKTPPVSLENPVTGQAHFLSVSAGFGG
jgi:hypothetical protein